jgi:hypothetical protein
MHFRAYVLLIGSVEPNLSRDCEDFFLRHSPGRSPANRGKLCGVTSAHSRSATASPTRRSSDPQAVAVDWLRRAERSVRGHRQELLLLAATVAFVVVVAVIGLAALSS